MSRLLDTSSRGDRLAHDLGAQRYLLLRSDDFSGALAADDLEAFSAEWESLPADEELVGGGRYRYRRYGRLRVEPGAEPAFTALPPAAFQQDARHIPLYGGRARTFAPIPEAVLLHPALHAIVGLDLDVAGRVASEVQVWLVGLHMVRVVAEPDRTGNPTPEGRHRDGHRFVGMHLLRRTDCRGGESLIYLDGGARPDVVLTLTEPMDSLLVDDTALEHEVTPIEAAGRRGVRDMLLVDLNPAAEE